MSMQGQDVRLCFVGDSFVAGIGDPAARGWVGRVTARALARGHDLSAYNLGVRRDTSVDVAARIGREVAPRLPRGVLAGVILSFGVNDTSWEDGRVRVPPAETVRSLRRMHQEVGTAELFLVGPPAVDESAQNERLRDTNQALREAAEDLGVPYVDSFTVTEQSPTWRREVREGDGYHPGAAGYEELATIIGEPFLTWLDAHFRGGTATARR